MLFFFGKKDSPSSTIWAFLNILLKDLLWLLLYLLFLLAFVMRNGCSFGNYEKIGSLSMEPLIVYWRWRLIFFVWVVCRAMIIFYIDCYVLNIVRIFFGLLVANIIVIYKKVFWCSDIVVNFLKIDQHGFICLVDDEVIIEINNDCQ